MSGMRYRYVKTCESRMVARRARPCIREGHPMLAYLTVIRLVPQWAAERATTAVHWPSSIYNHVLMDGQLLRCQQWCTCLQGKLAC